MKVYYIYGSAGCGKTSYVFQKHGYDDVYRTTNYEFGWIDDYNGEKILYTGLSGRAADTHTRAAL